MATNKLGSTEVAASTDTTASSKSITINTRYTYDSKQLDDLRKASPWTDDPKWFTSVSVSPTALVKMMTHCNSGVEKGTQKGGNPIEVMGLMLGRPDPLTPRTLVVTDVFPLPIEGFETRVIADDQDVVNHMIALGESLESTRKEKFMGWYHSHPFDVGEHSHCFLSQTDISTQLQWQRAEDPHGNPFLAIVVDPLRSLALSCPQIKAFRVYPPEYNSPIVNECPDGSIIQEEKERLEKWGNCWSRYYELNVDYFMSHSARNVMDILTKNLWMKSFGNVSSLEAENIKRYPDRLASISETLQKADVTSFTANLLNPPHPMAGAASETSATLASVTGLISGESHVSATTTTEMRKNRYAEDIKNACDGVVNLAMEKVHESITQVVKKDLFS